MFFYLNLFNYKVWVGSSKFLKFEKIHLYNKKVIRFSEKKQTFNSYTHIQTHTHVFTKGIHIIMLY